MQLYPIFILETFIEHLLYTTLLGEEERKCLCPQKVYSLVQEAEYKLTKEQLYTYKLVSTIN